tara:strand:+ start:1056 stop:2096 length:1041 start_codon:yes stop_codon:yes gene_type:complete
MKKKNLNVKKINHNLLLQNLKNKKIKKIYEIFLQNLKNYKKPKKIACGISGGPDSLALAFLLKCYEINENIKIYFFIVDHGLRANSFDEAKLVKKKLSKFNINCQILEWTGKKPSSNIQSKAREIRYSLIKKECEIRNINVLFTAHHFDDLYENFYLRIIRGSGLKGISSFNQLNSNYRGLEIFRPLINVNKNNLNYITKNVFNFYINDPSNNNIFFKRVKIRKFLNSLKGEGFQEDKIRLTLNNLKEANSALEYFSKENLKKNSNFIKSKKAFILNRNFFKNPDEVIIRSLTEIFQKISTRYYPPRGKSIKNIVNIFFNKNSSKTTLGGCILEKVKNSVIIYKET